ncbi:MAG: zinc ribbon domain-containing protein [Candidatus Moduliflexus flocculans]|nr:zinc ribbon domain-containing protein [Candidatus Moduliflexus flocculans]
MAIIRCPYCHAIIDENDKYCNNCGTQLLFTEDEAVEEEIPGEKIIDADVEEKDYTVDEPEDEKRPAAAKDLDTEIDEELEQELREETEEMALDELVAEEAGGEAGDDVTEEVILVDEIAASEAKAKDGSACSRKRTRRN